jgi:hypothetical protein
MAKPQCPKCRTDLKDDSVMAQCPKCGEFSFIDMDGVAHISEPDSEPAPIAPSDVAEPMFPEVFSDAPLDALPDHSIDEKSSNHKPIETPFEEFNLIDDNSLASASNSETQDAQFQASEPAPETSSEALPEAPADLDMDAFISGQNFEPEEIHEQEHFGQPGDALGLNGYANSEASQAKDGPLLFKILISGIDTKEMRESLREAIEDSRFGWDTAELMASIRGGKLELDSVPPVKASILVNRIKRLALDIRWEQYDIKQMDMP